MEATCFLRLLRGQTHAGAPGCSSRATAKLFFFFFTSIILQIGAIYENLPRPGPSGLLKEHLCGS